MVGCRVRSKKSQGRLQSFDPSSRVFGGTIFLRWTKAMQEQVGWARLCYCWVSGERTWRCGPGSWNEERSRLQIEIGALVSLGCHLRREPR